SQPVAAANDGSLDDLFAATPPRRGDTPSFDRPMQQQPVAQPFVPQPIPVVPQTAVVQPVAASQPMPASPAPTRAIPEDFLASFGARKEDGVSPGAMPLPINPAPSIPNAPVATAAQPAARLIPDDFDPLTAFGSPRTGGQPSPARPLPASPIIPAPQQLPPIPAARAPEPLSPALLADFVKVESPAAAPRATPASAAAEPFDPLEAMKSRREERKAALLEKAKGKGSVVPPIPLPPSPSGLSSSATPIASTPHMPAPPAISGNSMLPAEAIPAVTNPVPATDASVIAALLTGMGFPAERVTAEQGRAIAKEAGELVRETAEGLIALLAARRLLKAEFRMDETQVQPEENNALKHFKIAELALDELFLTKAGGFQPPAESVAAAFADLQQHAVLTMSAMQRAINLLFRRLSPDIIARDAEDEGGLRIRGLGARKGKWETYVESHARMSGNIDGVARQIIAEAFAQVQEEQARKAASAYWETKQ
ncbi:MAG: type VI secretion system-associated FHA domain protein TagH, partial [Rhizobiaceae bacterium]|nr:type VI secretion system-associated FHA domain protein TagH [Rhizobiaceae bacterium]